MRKVQTNPKFVIRGTRIVVHNRRRTKPIELAHEGHQGIARMKQSLRIEVWWPGCDKEAEAFCRICQVVSGPSNPEPAIN